MSLAAYTGPTDITTPGTVIDSKDITSCLRISASNVTIKRSRIRCAGDFGIYLPNGSTGLLVEDTEITSTSPTNRADWGIATWGGGATLRRLYIHGTQRGWNVGSNSVLEDSYIGQNVNPTDLHTNAIMSSGGADNVVIRRNTLRSEAGTYATSAIAMFPENWAGGANSNVTITNNLLAGGSYCTYLGHGPGESPNTGFTFTGNQFSTSVHADCGLYGPVHAWDAIAGNVWSNNTWADGPKAGQIVNP